MCAQSQADAMVQRKLPRTVVLLDKLLEDLPRKWEVAVVWRKV